MSFQWQNSKGYFTLGEVAEMLKELVGVGFEQYFWIRAEVVKMQTYGQSGHAYLTLADKENGQVKTEFRANIWASDFRRIQQKFMSETGGDFNQGQTMLLLGRPGFHPQYGLSINIRDIDTSFSLGEMARQRKETLEYLKLSGLLEKNQQHVLNVIPGRLAVISDASSDGYSDFISKLKEEGPQYRIRVQLFPAHLQGDAAVEGISKRLAEISQMHKDFDAVCIVRGGGGEVGMTCYDHKKMAEAVARCPIPVLTGIGHSTNLTVVEQISWKNLITPTDLAFFVLNRFHEESRRLDVALSALGKVPDMMKLKRSLLNELSRQAMRNTRIMLRTHRTNLEQAQREMHVLCSQILRNHKQQLEHKNQHSSQLVQARLKDNKRYVSDLQQVLGNTYNEWLFRRLQGLSLAETKVRLLDPLQVLKRGYSIAYHQDKALRSAKGLKPGAEIKVRLYTDTLHVKLDTFESHDNEEKTGRH